MTNSSVDSGRAQFVPIIRSDSCAEIGHRKDMEDKHICVDDLSEHLGLVLEGPKPNVFYGVFDGHYSSDVAIFVRKNLLRIVFEDADFLQLVKEDGNFFIAAEKAVKNAFLVVDHCLADHCDIDSSLDTTILKALISRKSLLVGNVGDFRTVLCRRGRAMPPSRDHKLIIFSERLRIEDLGGYVYDGYLNGELSVSRALGDMYIKIPKGSLSPLSSEPAFQQVALTEEDEFLIIGCDGIWDVISNKLAVSMVREELKRQNEPEPE